MSECIHELRPEECALCNGDDWPWHEGIAHAKRKASPDVETLLQRMNQTLTKERRKRTRRGTS